jgi:5'-nucleotidase
LDVVGGPVDLVVSGINHGPNLGWDLTYSGTVSAAMEGIVMGIPSLAVSVASYKDIDYSFAAEFSAFLARKLVEHTLPPSVLLNVNVPGVPVDQIKGIEVTRQGKRHYAGRLEKRIDPMGRAYYWLGGDEPLDELEEGTDVKAITDGRVSVTPVHLDLTGYAALDLVRDWGVDEFRYKPDGYR